MTKEEKIKEVAEITEKLKEFPNFIVANSGGMSVAQVNNLRRLCFESGVEMRVVKNTLFRKALENSAGNYEEVYPHLKTQSSVFFTNENTNAPAKVIKKFRKGTDKPMMKVAYIEDSVFVGDGQLAVLEALKSKNELIGEVIGLLQSPFQNLMGALQSGGNTVAGLVKTLSERQE